MAHNIDKYIESINNGLEWIKKNRPEQYDQRFFQLADERRKLRVLRRAQDTNPGIAAFGNSQVGKSYLMNCILRNSDSPFMVDAPDREYKFIQEINPIGGGGEATGVVTRFSSYSRNEADYSAEYPIRMRTLSVKDIILIICDSYFTDIIDFTTAGEMDLIGMSEAIFEKYSAHEEEKHPVLIADDLLEIKLYFRKYINAGQVYSSKTPFFDRLAQIIHRVPVADYADLFSVLWNKDQRFTDLFKTCLNILQRLKFSEYIYLPISAVAHENKEPNTIMSVACLGLLFSPEKQKYTTDVYIGTPQNIQKVETLTKSELCAVCLEVVIKIREQFITNSGRYDMRDIPSETQALLTQGDVPMKVLKECDLLDFPGARARLNIKLSQLSGLTSNLINCYLRGKVAYLFNKYNDEKTLNILLYCHHQKNLEATQMHNLLAGWVDEYVGNTPEKRAAFIAKTGISPLFHIGTMFNVDFSYPDTKIEYSEQAFEDVWEARFIRRLLVECLIPSQNKWVNNWTGNGVPFQNCYMLRDFKYSRPEACNIYAGVDEDGNGTEQSMVIDRAYYELKRQTFCSVSNKKTHLFANPALSWDVAASIGNDGSVYIIEQLSKLAERISSARESQIAEQIAAACKACYNILRDYYVSSNADELLDANIRKANYIFRELEFTCQSEPEYFGHLLQALQYTESESFKEIHKFIPTLTATVNDGNAIKDYELIRKRCNNFDGCPTMAEKWERFIEYYHFTSQDEASDYLKKRGIESDVLFKGETIKRKNSAVIANHMMTLWEKKLTDVQFVNNFAGDGQVDEIAVSYLVDCVVSTAKSLHLMQTIENDIADYVDVLNTANINQDLIADMIATTISDYVMDFGYRYLSPTQVDSARKLAKSMHLPCFEYTEQVRKENYDDEEMTHLFDDILTSSNRYTPAYEANYNSWLEYLYVAFIAHLNVPDPEKREANDALKQILDELEA